MADFKFNFTSADSDEEADISPSGTHAKLSTKPTIVRQAKEILIQSNPSAYPSSKIEETHIGDGIFSIKHVSESNVEENLKDRQDDSNNDIITAAEKSSDLIPSVYEGGLKIWECSVDLVEYLLESGMNFQGKRVLEIGCGAGLPGIYALLQGAEVHFQDYNDDVIEHVTIPNVLLNLEQQNKQCNVIETAAFDLLETARQCCRFFSGDWGNVADFINPDLVRDVMYDVILTSETIYSVESHAKLYHFIKRHLKKPDGLAYVAAKTHYFGVGGGTRSFEKLVMMDGVFNVSVCKVYSDGVQREILCMKYT
ncbi:Histidine protein methyltransferase 1 [Desmophyllum pertusum]|uniref:protein-histidine N-methyltransferase n=1 Tax=Desmophyllum pertusum TaxID=174260 RepID=A0A9W9YJW0_9CNID|nr:Histidine protein methyltransferase 1 [Desmophyllum pertusum]